MKGGALLMKCLEAQGVKCIFGMPGTQNLPIYDALREHGGIDHYLVRHEYSATIAADGFARATGDVGVAITVPGPGASNASTGVLEAFTDCVPVLLITGQSETRLYERDSAKQFHGLDQMRFFEPITKYCAIAYQTDDIPRVVEEAFLAMRSGRPGPTMLEFPADVILGDVRGEVPALARVERVFGEPAPADVIAGVAERLNGLTRPLILAGKAVIDHQAREPLRHLAEKLQAPVATTRLGKGALPEDHPLALADVRGFLAGEALQAADATIAVGVRFTSIDSRNWTEEFPQPIIQLDPDPAEIGREYPCELGIAGDLAGSLRRLGEAVAPRKDEWTRLLAPWRKRFAEQQPLPLLPELRKALPDDGIIAVDVHGIGYSTFAEYPITDPRTYLYPCIGVSLGHAFGQAIGAKVAYPDRPVVAFCGDGGFLMGSFELATAVRYGIGVVVVVVNDGALTAIKGSQRKHYEGRTIDTDLTNPDFLKLAEAFGVWAKRVENVVDFGDVLAEAMAVGAPALVEVMLRERQEEVIEWVSWLRDEPLRE